MKIRKLNITHIINLHAKLIKYTGGMTGLRNYGLLDSAVEMPFMSYGGKSLYPGIRKKAARLSYGIIKNHPFNDGNKRIGILAMLELLRINGFRLKCPHDKLIKLGLSVAGGTFGHSMKKIFLLLLMNMTNILKKYNRGVILYAAGRI